MADLTLYTNPMSRGRMARHLMEELGQTYDTQILDFGTTMKAPEYLAINPMGKVPAIRHGDVIVTEGAAICAYLADAFPQSGLAPASGSDARGAYYRWMFFGAGPVEAAVTNTSLGFQTDTPELRSRVGYGALGDVMDALEGLLADGREWLLGDAFSAVDIYLGGQISWGVAFKTMEARPGFIDYVTRLRSRPAAIRAAEIDDALIAEAQKGDT